MNAWTSLWQELASPFALSLVGVLAGVAVFLVARRGGKASRGPGRVAEALTSQPFERGFDLLLDGRWQEAVEGLKAAVKTDPNRILEYLAIGKLFRRQGQPGRAARLFEQLGARSGLDHSVRSTAQYELALSYHALGWYEPAVTLLEQVLAADPSRTGARQELRRMHEDMGCWEKAAALEMLRLKRGETRDHQTLAALLTQQGKVAWAAGHLHDSAAYLRAALGLAPDCTEAAIYLGRVLLRQEKLSQAFRIWDELAKIRPEWLFLAFRDMQMAFQRLNNEAGWERFLRTFTERHPGDPIGHLALAEWYASRGQPTEAIQCLRQVLELDPVCREAHLGLLSLCREHGVRSELHDSYERLAQHTTWPSGSRFRCRTCGHTAYEPFWRCPACHLWATPERLIPQPSAMPVGTRGIISPCSQANLDAPASVVVRRDAPTPHQSDELEPPSWPLIPQ
jgi:lipopolysaccharide biosynthesis regulator YciM